MSYLQIKVDLSEFGIDKKLPTAANRAVHILATQMMADTTPFVPALTTSLSNRTQVINNMIVYPGPYARYLYYGKYMVNAATGKGPMHYVDKNNNEVIRYPKGSKLMATNRDLVFTTSVHPQAQAHWFEASKAQNLDKWKRVAGRLLADELGS